MLKNALGKNPARIERLRLKDRRYALKAQRNKNPDKIERLRLEDGQTCLRGKDMAARLRGRHAS